MQRVMAMTTTNGLTTVTLTYYADGAQQPWAVRTLPNYDLGDPTITEDAILNAVTQVDRQIKRAYDQAGVLTTELGDLLGQRITI
jgi:hypothetical protein